VDDGEGWPPEAVGETEREDGIVLKLLGLVIAVACLILQIGMGVGSGAALEQPW
jgi:hypothetical protein